MSTRNEEAAMKAQPTEAQLPEAQPLGMLLVISGPAGVGKDTVWRAASVCLPGFAKAITCTTRPRRCGEEDGAHYFFVSDEEFDRLIHEDQLIEWAHVHNARYGVPAAQVLERLAQGLDVVCVIDVQGARRIKALFPQALLVFLKPPAGRETDVLAHRMAGRGTTDDQEVARRLDSAAREMAQTDFYDYKIVNDEVSQAAQQLCEIVTQARTVRAQQAQAGARQTDARAAH
ncbi:MAG TPA: guanylate kinase [Abditibacteriaceae bacterium]|nr:guanylate kinase [Abditibacteriaceae bacterium]